MRILNPKFVTSRSRHEKEEENHTWIEATERRKKEKVMHLTYHFFLILHNCEN
jgi:hypothetical protein